MRAFLLLALVALSSASVVDQQGQLQATEGTCAGYQCCEGYALRPGAAEIPCEGACSIPQCCMPTCAASQFKCNAPLVPKGNPQDILCDTQAASIGTSFGFTGYICTQAKCCIGVSPEHTCKEFSCCEGYTLRPDATTTECSGNCSVAQCCIPTCAAPTFQCKAPLVLKENPKSIVCDTKASSIGSSLGFTGYICTNSRCCIGTSPVTCAGYQCPAGQTSKPSSTTCPSSRCSDADCCNAPAAVCFTPGSPVQQCTGGRVPQPNPTCVADACNQANCCDETCGSADLPTLCAGREINLAARSHVCQSQDVQGNGCLVDECCLQTCASDNNLRCPPNTVLRADANEVICEGGSCPTSLCCIADRPQCPVDFPCTRNPGDVRKHLPQECNQSPCNYDECCCSACNYCGTQFHEQCPVGSRLALNVDCGKDRVCSADICCVASCANYACPDGPADPALATAQCANPRQCTAQECCQRYED